MFDYIIYARKSTEDEEKQQLSIPAQVIELKQFAAKEKLNVVDILTETKSAKTPGRPIFNELLERIKAGEAKGILSWHPDRLARNSVDAGQIGYLLTTGKLLDLKFPTFWFESTPQGLFMLNMAFSQSQYFSDALSVNTARGLRQKCRMGWLPCQAPRGYINDRLHKTIKVDPKTAPFIQKLFRLYATGNHTMIGLSQKFKKLGLITPFGNQLKIDAIKKILTNRFYCGSFFYAGEFYQGKHKPLVSKKLFDRVQEILKGRTYRRKTKSVKNFPFTGLLKCGQCGNAITAETHVKCSKGGNRLKFIYYRCTRKNKNIVCRQPFIRQPELDRQLSDLIYSVRINNYVAGWFKNRLEQDKQSKQKFSEKITTDLQSQIGEQGTKLEKLMDLYLSGLTERDEYLKRRKTIIMEKSQLNEKVIKIQKGSQAWLEPMENWIKLGEKAKETSQLTDGLAKKRAFLFQAGSNLTLRDKKVCCIWPIPFARLAARPTDRELEA